MSSPVPDKTRRIATVVSAALGATSLLLVAFGWSRFEFDPALVVYAGGTMLALVLTVYRLAIWVQRPPTRMIFRQSLRYLFLSHQPIRHIFYLLPRVLFYFGLNTFVWRRGRHRWCAHWPMMVGCLMALGIVTPLMFGWVWFETPPDDLNSYRVMCLGLHVRTIPVDSSEAFVGFHGLVWASIPVVLGVTVALVRRIRDRGDRATQTFANDILPLLAVLTIAVTGLLMTISYSFLGGFGHEPIALVHCIAVLLTLLWLPYSKLIHIPQRGLKLAHFIYERAAAEAGAQACVRCRREFGPRSQVLDLIQIEQQLGYQYQIGRGADHYQFVCPPCRRAMLVLAHGRCWQPTAALEPQTV